MPKKVAVFFKQPGVKAYPFTKEEYWRSYQELDREIKKCGGQLYIVRDNTTYLGNGRFFQSWQFKNGDIIESGEITVDKIYDKGEFKSDGTVPVLNNDTVNIVCTNKWKTYEVFKDFCPQTFLATNENEFKNALQRITGNIKVIKPLDDEEGNGVFIGDDEYLMCSPKVFPILVQEFLNTSSGIPGIYKGVHDFRVVFLNGEIMYSFFRTPPEGSLLANVAQGGSLQLVPHDKIPKEVFNITTVVQKNFSGDYCFGVDVGFVNGKPKIIELNSRVALFSAQRGADFLIFIQKLAKVLVS